LIGLGCVLLTIAAVEAFRLVWFEPRAVGLACLHGTGPDGVCAARAAMGWLIYHRVLGGAALIAGIAAMAGAPFGFVVAAVCCGAAGLIEYNVSFGMLGAVLGAWVWLRPVRGGGAYR
jgi:hypothetical protein